MLDLSERNEPVDLITLAEALKARGELQDVGGAAFLAELAARVPTAANIVHYARIVRDRSVLRGLIAGRDRDRDARLRVRRRRRRSSSTAPSS